MAKKNGNNAIMRGIFSNPEGGVISGVVFQKNGVVRRRISTHKKIVVKKLNK
jgi:hypothetical protein